MELAYPYPTIPLEVAPTIACAYKTCLRVALAVLFIIAKLWKQPDVHLHRTGKFGVYSDSGIFYINENERATRYGPMEGSRT